MVLAGFLAPRVVEECFRGTARVMALSAVGFRDY